MLPILLVDRRRRPYHELDTVPDTHFIVRVGTFWDVERKKKVTVTDLLSRELISKQRLDLEKKQQKEWNRLRKV